MISLVVLKSADCASRSCARGRISEAGFSASFHHYSHNGENRRAQLSADGAVSFTGMDYADYQPIVEVPIEFPPLASSPSTSALVWKAQGKATARLTDSGFMDALTQELH